MLDIYTPISKQHKHLRGKADRCLKECMRTMGHEDINIRAFAGGYYPSNEDVVGDADIVVVYTQTRGDWIGKGAVSEFNYARKNGILTLALSMANNPQLRLLETVTSIDNGDWAQHAKLCTKEIDKKELGSLLRRFGVKMPVEGKIYKDTYDEEYLLL